ncbi:MAG: hypothetical protein DCF20_11520 [Pseudanabaena sp.]|nr:MAG: hypothetical protein DCF20_11520 [Pseudanabaena sp.]
MIGQRCRAIAVFSNFEAAGQALYSLTMAGFPLAKIFLVGRDMNACIQNGQMVTVKRPIEEKYAGTISGTGLGLKKGWLIGNGVGGTVGLCLGIGILSLPGVGQIALANAVIFTMISSGIFTAAGGLVGALIGLVVTEKQANTYNKLIAQGKYLIVMNGSELELKRAEQMLASQEIRK